jgi:hypothetical protein
MGRRFKGIQLYGEDGVMRQGRGRLIFLKKKKQKNFMNLG